MRFTKIVSADCSLGPHRLDAFAARMRTRFIKSTFAMSAKLGRPLPVTIGQSEDRNFHALNQYEPQPYGDPIHLFRCTGIDRFDGSDPLLGWGRLATQIVVHHIPGQRGDVIREPYVHTLGAAVENCVQSMENEISSKSPASAPVSSATAIPLPKSA